MKGRWRKLCIWVENIISCTYTIIIGNEHRHKNFDGIYEDKHQVHKERASAAADLSELIPGGISGGVILLCGPIGDKANHGIQNPILQQVSNASLPCGSHFRILGLLCSSHTMKSARGV